jgi:hypothetical protein
MYSPTYERERRADNPKTMFDFAKIFSNLRRSSESLFNLLVGAHRSSTVRRSRVNTPFLWRSRAVLDLSGEDIRHQLGELVCVAGALEALRSGWYFSNSWLSALTLRASPLMEIRAVDAINMAARFALERPDILIVIGALKRRLAQKALSVPIGFAFFRHLECLHASRQAYRNEMGTARPSGQAPENSD